MKSAACCFWILACSIAPVSAQEMMAVSQVEMFKTSGTVNGVATSASGTETGSTPRPVATTTPNPAVITQAGGTISTGADGAASLMLGEGGAIGSARMSSDTEIKVPAAGEKNHSLEILKGCLFMKIDGTQLKQKSGAEFKLKTPAALLAVKGTQFFTQTSNGTRRCQA